MALVYRTTLRRVKTCSTNLGIVIDVGIANNDNERNALLLLESMENGSLLATVERLCTEDFSWENSGLPTVNGQEELRALVASGGFSALIPIIAATRRFEADVLHIASSGDVVFTERIDHFWDAEGRDLMTPRIGGVIEFRDGKMCSMREYYDTACYSQEPTTPSR